MTSLEVADNSAETFEEPYFWSQERGGVAGRPASKAQIAAGPCYVAYYRVSTADQGSDGDGSRAQKTNCRRMAAEGSGGVIVKELSEVRSAASGDNTELLRFIVFAKDHRCTLLLNDTDRLARSQEQRADVARCLKRNRVPTRFFRTMDETTTKMHEFFAEHERSTIARRTKAALQQRKLAGRYSLLQARKRAPTLSAHAMRLGMEKSKAARMKGRFLHQEQVLSLHKQGKSGQEVYTAMKREHPTTYLSRPTVYRIVKEGRVERFPMHSSEEAAASERAKLAWERGLQAKLDLVAAEVTRDRLVRAGKWIARALGGGERKLSKSMTVDDVPAEDVQAAVEAYEAWLRETGADLLSGRLPREGQTIGRKKGMLTRTIRCEELSMDEFQRAMRVNGATEEQLRELCPPHLRAIVAS